MASGVFIFCFYFRRLLPNQGELVYVPDVHHALCVSWLRSRIGWTSVILWKTVQQDSNSSCPKFLFSSRNGQTKYTVFTKSSTLSSISTTRLRWVAFSVKSIQIKFFYNLFVGKFWKFCEKTEDSFLWNHYTCRRSSTFVGLTHSSIKHRWSLRPWEASDDSLLLVSAVFHCKTSRKDGKIYFSGFFHNGENLKLAWLFFLQTLVELREISREYRRWGCFSQFFMVVS